MYRASIVIIGVSKTHKFEAVFTVCFAEMIVFVGSVINIVNYTLS